MSLQLLVENAIKHGIEKNKLGGVILIKSVCKENKFQLSVINSGNLKVIYSSNNTGVGIKNYKKSCILIFKKM